MKMLFRRFFASLLCTAACLASLVAPAQAQLAPLASLASLAIAPQSGLQLERLEVLHNVPTGLSLTQVLSGEAGAFVEATDLQISHPHWYRSMWLRLHFKASPNWPSASDQAVLFFPKPYLDDLRLYTPGKQAGQPWAVQRAGDFVPPSLWPTRSLHPKFLLPSAERVAALEGKSMVLYLQMEHLAPVMLGVNLRDSQTSLEEDALSLLIYGLGLGAILISVVVTSFLAWIHRDAIYAWYSLYAMAALLACASHSGIAHHVLWPVGGIWPGTAVLWFLMLSCIGQIQFARCVNTNGQSHPRLNGMAHGVSAACLSIMVCFPIFDSFWQQMYFAALILFALVTLTALVFMLRGWHMGNKLARVWLLAYFPLGVTVVLALLEGVGIVPSTYWSYSLVILGVCLEVLVLGLALQWFARERHGARERMKVLADVDPLTGFINAQAFAEQLQRDWHSQAARRLDHAVVYIELRTHATSAAQLEDFLKRSVRIMRSATSASDVVSRLEGTLMAISMPHVQMGDDLSQRLSRIVALGLMPDRSDPQAQVLQFRIAATTHQHFNAPFAQLDVQLRELLAQDKGWGSKPIRFVDGISPKADPSILSTMPDLDDVWEKAFRQEQKDESAAAKS